MILLIVNSNILNQLMIMGVYPRSPKGAFITFMFRTKFSVGRLTVSNINITPI